MVGIGQPTATTARVVEERIESVGTIEGRDLAGDGTVARLAARPKSLGERDPSIRGVGEGHGSLAAHRSVLDQLDFVLTAENRIYRAPDAPSEESVEWRTVGVSVAELHESGEPVQVTVRIGDTRVLEVVAVDEAGGEGASELVRFGGEVDEAGRTIGIASFDRLDPGGYVLVVRAPDDPSGMEVPAVRATTLVLAE